MAAPGLGAFNCSRRAPLPDNAGQHQWPPYPAGRLWGPGAGGLWARDNDSLDPRVVCGQHGWWQACPEIGAPGYDPFAPEGANFNLAIGNAAIDPISGSVPHRAYVCQVRLVGDTA